MIRLEGKRQIHFLDPPSSVGGSEKKGKRISLIFHKRVHPENSDVHIIARFHVFEILAIFRGQNPVLCLDDEIAAIEEQYASEGPRGAEPRFWEDVNEGDTVGPIVKGPLTVTDANVMTGKLVPDFFPRIFGLRHDETLDREAVRKAFKALVAELITGDYDSAKSLATISTISFIVGGALMFGQWVIQSGMPQQIVRLVVGLQLTPLLGREPQLGQLLRLPLELRALGRPIVVGVSPPVP